MPARYRLFFMKILILFVFSLQSTILCFSQHEIDKKIASDACKCIDSKLTLDYSVIGDCLGSAMMQNQSEFRSQYLPKTSENDSTGGYKAGQELARNLAIDLVDLCDKYFKFFDTVRYSIPENVNIDTVRLQLKNSDTLSPNTIALDDCSKFGVGYFFLKDYDKSLKFLDYAAKHDTTGFRAQYFYALVLEKKGRFNDAIKLYTDMAEKSGEYIFQVFEKIANRKKNSL